MAGKIVSIEDYATAGELFIALAKDPDKIPATLDAKIALLRSAGIHVDGFKDIQFPQNGTVLHLVLPAKELIEQAERDVGAMEDVRDDGYGLPAEKVYEDYFEPDRSQRPSPKLFLNVRVGDYTCSQCR